MLLASLLSCGNGNLGNELPGRRLDEGVRAVGPLVWMCREGQNGGQVEECTVETEERHKMMEETLLNINEYIIYIYICVCVCLITFVLTVRRGDILYDDSIYCS